MFYRTFPVSALYLQGITGENLISAKCNSTILKCFSFYMKKNSSSVGESNGTVLSTGNFGKKARNSPRSMVRKCDEANGSVIFRLFRQERERGIRLQLFLFFHKKIQWKGNRKDCCTICCPTKTTIFFFRSKGSATSSFKKNEYRKGGAPLLFLTARKQLIGWLVFPAG